MSPGAQLPDGGAVGGADSQDAAPRGPEGPWTIYAVPDTRRMEDLWATRLCVEGPELARGESVRVAPVEGLLTLSEAELAALIDDPEDPALKALGPITEYYEVFDGAVAKLKAELAKLRRIASGEGE